MVTKLNKDIVRETNIEVDGRALIVMLGGDNTVGFKLKGLNTDYSKVHITRVCAMSEGFEPGDKPGKKSNKVPSGHISVKAIYDALEEEKDMPWPYKAALRKFLRRRFK